MENTMPRKCPPGGGAEAEETLGGRGAEKHGGGLPGLREAFGGGVGV